MQFSTVPRAELLLVQQVELIASQLCGAQMFGRAAEVLGKLLDRPDVTADRVGRVVAPLKILQHALTQSGHRSLLPMIRTLAFRSSSATPLLSLRRASGFVVCWACSVTWR
jgi:hypothetical protein